MKKPKDTKHLQLRYNTWWLYYKIPKHLKGLPQFENHPSIYTESLHTDSLTKAKQLRDSIIYKLNSVNKEPYDAWGKEIINRANQFVTDNPHLNGQHTYKDLLLDNIINEAGNQSGVDTITGHPISFTDKQQLKLDVITKKKPDKHKQLRFITDKVTEESRANDLAQSTILKIRRSTDWFLGHLLQDDIDITSIDYDQVHDFLVLEQNNGVAGSTLNGHLYGLRQCWKRAKQSKLVEGDNPFSYHNIKKDSKPYDPFRYDEIYQMYKLADESIRPLIHAGATTGARLGELMTAEIKTPSTVDYPCWIFKFKDKGKTKESTRVVPVHSSLNLPDGFTFDMNDRSASRQFKELKESTLGKPLDELTDQPRRLSFHSFRSTVVTELTVNNSINEKVAGAVTGHLGGDTSKTGSIRTYIHATELDKKKELVQLLPWEL